MARGYLDIRPLNEKYFLCRVNPIHIPAEKPAGLRAVPWREGLTPVYRLKSGEFRSDGSRYEFWGGDSRLPLVDRAAVQADPDWRVSFAGLVIATTPNPRLRVVFGRFDLRCGLVADALAIHQEDIAPWYSVSSLFPSYSTRNLPSLLQLAESGRVTVGMVHIAETVEASFVPRGDGLDEVEWLSLGWHSVAAPNRTCSAVVRPGSKAEGLPLPRTYDDMARHGIGWAPDVEIRGCELVQGKLMVPKCVLAEPNKAASWFGEPRLAGVPAGSRLIAERCYYGQFRTSIEEFAQFEFCAPDDATKPLEFEYNANGRTLTFPNQQIVRLSSPVQSRGYNGWIFVPDCNPVDFVKSDELGRKFAIPENVVRHKLYGLKNGSFRELPGTYVRKSDCSGLQRVTTFRKARKETAAEAARQITEAVGEIPQGFDARWHKVDEAIECVKWKRLAERGEAEDMGSAADRLMAVVPMTKAAAEEIIAQYFPVVKTPISGVRYVEGRRDFEQFVEEHAGEILCKIDRRWLGFVHRAMLSDVAQNSIALAFLGGA